MVVQDLINKLKKFSFFDTFKHTSTYFSGTMIAQLLGLISLPVFTAYLSSEEYGIINVFATYVTTGIVLLSLNLHCSTSRYYFEKDKDDFGSFLATTFIAVTVSFLVLGSLVFYFREPIATLVNLPVHLVKWVIVMCYLLVIYYTFTQILIATKQSKTYATIEVVLQYLKFGFTVVGLIYLTDVFYVNDNTDTSYTFMGKIIGETIVTVLMVLYALRQISRYISFKGLSFQHLKYGLIYGIPLIPFSLSSTILNFFDQWYINSVVGHEAAGNYAFAYKIGMIYLGLGLALMNGANPSYHEYMNKKSYHQVWQQVDSMTKLLVLAGGFLILFAVDAGTLLSSNDSFLDALPMTPVIVGAYVFWGISSFANRGITFVKKNIYLAFIVLVSGATNIFLNAHFIPLYGYQVAAYTTLVSYFCMMVLSIVITTYFLKLPPLPLGRILKYIVLLGFIVSLNYLIGEPNIGMHFGWILFKSVLFGLLGLGLFYNKIGLLLFNKPMVDEEILDRPNED